MEAYRQKRKQLVRLFRNKKRRLEESEREEMELLYCSQETRGFFRKLNDSRNGFVPRAEMCRDKEGGILADERKVIQRWRQHYDEHLNGAQADNEAYGEDD